MQHIGRYRILGELGRGAMGVVYGALDPTIGRHVAIKTIRLADISDPQERQRLQERLLREAQSAGVLSHPGIVIVYDVGQQDELAYIAMEFVNGPSLEKVLATEKALAPERVIDILHQTAAALDYAHKKGIVHRDIKPANIMIQDDGTAKIADFGVAKISTSASLTQAGAVLGTPNYMSPEQIQGKPVDGNSDQFSLAVIAYEMLTGEKPFVADQLPTVLYKIVSEPPAPPQTLNPSLSPSVAVVLNKALAKDPAQRYPTCSVFVTALEAALATSKGWKPVPHGAGQTLPTAVVAPDRLGPMAARREQALHEPERRRTGLRIVLLLLALVAAGGIAFLFWNGRQWFAQPPAAAQVAQQQSPDQAQVPQEGRPSPMTPPAPPQAAPAPGAETTGTTPVQQAPEPKPAETQETKPAEPEPAKPAEPAEQPKPIEEKPKPARREEPVRTRPAAVADQPVQIITSPPGATVLIDSGDTCKSPCSLTLKPGRHTIAAKLNGYKDELRILDLGSEPREMFIGMRKAFGTVRVESTPIGARIFVNNQQRAELTPATLNLPPGKYNITVVRNGTRAEQDVTVSEGELVKINFSLNP